MNTITYIIINVVLLIIISAFLWRSSTASNDNEEQDKVEYGDLFYKVCSMNIGDIYVDKITKIIYIKSDDSIQALLDKSGKPKKYKSLEDLFKN